ncbi:hypothetical protein WI372_05640 [Gemmatimonadota bacterium DH-20]|uniref:Uncharacterized protein n=1 Tax=Gaopeijia maritima TaxID=3119007 RepID=A0ABU9E7E3_9BACT
MNDDSRRDSPDDLPEEWLEMARTTYHPPGDTPREEMWEAISARISAEPRSIHSAPSRRLGGWISLAAAAGVALMLGVGLGRWSMPDAAPPNSAEPPARAAADAARPTEGGAAVRLATARHLNDADALLSFVSVDASGGRADRDVGVWGRQLLTETRLLLDSSVGGDPAVRRVLEDLEIVLAQIALLGSDVDPARARSELDLIAEGLRNNGVRGRIHSVLPSVSRSYAAADD